MSALPDPPSPTAPPQPPDLRRRQTPVPPSSTATAQPVPPAQQTSTSQQQPPPQPTFLSRAMTGAVGLGIVTAAVGGTYMLSENDAMFPFAVAACVATFSSVLLRLALIGVKNDGTTRARVRHFRSHRHLTGERAAYARTSQRLAMMDRDFTPADYEMLLDLDNNSQRLRRFLEGASHETVARLPTFVFRAEKAAPKEAKDVVIEGTEEEPVGERKEAVTEPVRTVSAADLNSLQKGKGEDAVESTQGDEPELASDTTKSCTICLEDFEDGMKIRVLPCFHRFMADCIDPWLVQQARCPVCKRNIQEEMNKLPPGLNSSVLN